MEKRTELNKKKAERWRAILRKSLEIINEQITCHESRCIFLMG